MVTPHWRELLNAFGPVKRHLKQPDKQKLAKLARGRVRSTSLVAPVLGNLPAHLAAVV
jgi:hypothetical protein